MQVSQLTAADMLWSPQSDKRSWITSIMLLSKEMKLVQATVIALPCVDKDCSNNSAAVSSLPLELDKWTMSTVITNPSQTPRTSFMSASTNQLLQQT
jgi:hypothetical protein